MIYWLYKNRKTDALLWSKKTSFSDNPIDLDKWALIGEYSTRTLKFIVYDDCYFGRLD